MATAIVEAAPGVLAVDADGHVGENTAAIVEYMEQPYREFRAGFTGPGGLTPIDGHDRSLGRRLYHGPAGRTEDWLRALDWGPMEWTVLYPSIGLFYGFIRDPDYQAAYCRAYNTWLAKDMCAPSGGRVLGMALLPVEHPDEAVNELRRGKQLGLVGGVYTADGPTHLLGHRRFDPVYEAARDLDMCIGIHASGSSLAPGAELFPKFIQTHTVAHPYGILRQFTSMMFEGVFERFPAVRFAFLEAGAAWAPWWLDRMDEEYEHRGAVDAPALAKPPSHYVRQGCNIFFGSEANERLLEAAMQFIGDDCVMYASDYPHWDGAYPVSLREMAARPNLTPAQKYGVLRGAAERFYGLAK
ncbi:MAG: amidohydrolase family protein [Chloroflexota bacterium]|nr:amidohydrolase family protein [Chloroflexota bacterium]